MLTHQIREKLRSMYISIPWTLSVELIFYLMGKGSFLLWIEIFWLNSRKWKPRYRCKPSEIRNHIFPLQTMQHENLGSKRELDHVIFFQSLLTSFITLLLSKTALLISLVYLYDSVSTHCLWFLMQNSTQLLILWPVCLYFNYPSNTFFHHSYKTFSKGRINISSVHSTAANITDQEHLF